MLDLSELDFIGAAGLVALANAEKSFAEAGVELTVRTPSRLVRATSRRHGAERGGPPRSGPRKAWSSRREQAGGSSHRSPPSSSRPHVEDLRRVTAIPADSDVVDGALRLVVELAQISVSGADGVSVSLLRHGELLTVAATDETIMEMDTDQYATGEGPCVDASRRGRWFHAESLETETRWPSFTPRARALGIMAILSSPLTALEEPVGALNIYSRTASTFDVEDQQTAAVFARKASVILSRCRVPASRTHSWLFDFKKRCAVERSSRQPRESSWSAKASMRTMPSPTFCVSRSEAECPSSIGPNRSHSRLTRTELGCEHRTDD